MSHHRIMHQDLEPSIADELPADGSILSSTTAAADSPVTIDAYLTRVGEFGRYQQRHYALVAGGQMAAAWVTLNMVFVNQRPRWHSTDGHVTADSLPCDIHNLTLVDVHWTVAGEWHLVCGDAYFAAELSVLYFLGFLCGASALGWIADRYGRCKACSTACFLGAAGTLASSVAPSYRVHAACRFLAGLGLGGLGTSCYVLASEFIGPSWQSLTGNGQAAIFALGGVLLTPVSLLLPSWRALAAASALPCVCFLLIFLLLVPESPRWLLANGKDMEASAILVEIGRVNGTVSPDERPPLLVSGLSNPSCPITHEAPEVHETTGVLSLFTASPQLRRRTLVMLCCWFTASFTYYGLSLNAGNMHGSLHFNFALSCAVEVPAALLAGYSCDRIGRKAALSVAFALAGLLCLICALLSPGTPRVAVATAGKFSIAAAFAILFVYAAELFPTVLRSVGMGLSSSAARVGGMAAPAVVLLTDVNEGLPLCVFSTVSFLACMASLLLPETVGMPLPETTADCAAATQSAKTKPRQEQRMRKHAGLCPAAELTLPVQRFSKD